MGWSTPTPIYRKDFQFKSGDFCIIQLNEFDIVGLGGIPTTTAEIRECAAWLVEQADIIDRGPEQ